MYNSLAKLKMPKKKTDIAHRARNLLRLTLIWTSKGGVFKRIPMMDLRLLPKYLKSLLHLNNHRGRIRYGEREFSFDDTPIIHVKMHRPSSMRFPFRLPHIPCINPQVDFDYDFGYSDDNDDITNYNNDGASKSFLKGEDEDEDDNVSEVCEEIVPCDEEGVDKKAEEFIAKFYEQMKLQRQRSYLQYNEMLNRGAS